MSKSEDHEVEPEATVPVEIPVAGVGAGVLGLTSLVMVNYVDITPETLALVTHEFADAAIIGIGGGGLGMLVAGKFTESFLAPDPRADSKFTTSACSFARLAALGSTSWLALNQYAGEISTGSVLSLIGGAALAAFVAWLHRRKLDNVSEDILEEQRTAHAEAIERERVGDWGVILKRAGYKRKCKTKNAEGVETETEEPTLDIVDQGEIEDSSLGTTIGIWARVTGDPDDFAKLFYDKAENKIGNAAQKVIGHNADITTSAVTIDRDRKEGFATINILTTDIMDGVSEFRLKPHEVGPDGNPLPSDPTENIDVGRHPNGKRTRIKKWRKHIEIIGASQTGKSSLINIIFERLGRSKKSAMFVGGNWKLYRMVGVWLEGMTHEGGNNPCLFDWVAPNQTRILEMLATAYEYADMRESAPEFQALGEDNPTEKWPSIEIILDEAHKVLKHDKMIMCHDGIKRNASMLVDELTSGATSAFVHVTLATQAALMADLGDVGNRIKGNTSVSIAFQSGRDDWLTKTISTVAPTKNQTHLGAKGSFYLQQENVPGWLSKADFIRKELIPAMAAIRGHMRGTIPEEHYSKFTVGTYPDKEGKPTCANAYTRRFSFGEGGRDEFVRAVMAGAKYKEAQHMATSGAARGGTGNGPQPGTPEHDEQVLGLDPNMSMEEANRRMTTVFERNKMNRKVGDQDQVDAAFADIAAQLNDEDTDDGHDTSGGVPGIVATILDAAEGFDTITTREVAIVLGLLEENEDDDDTVSAAARDAADQVFAAIGLRTEQPRDRDKRHGASRPRGYKVDKIREAAAKRRHDTGE